MGSPFSLKIQMDCPCSLKYIQVPENRFPGYLKNVWILDSLFISWTDCPELTEMNYPLIQFIDCKITKIPKSFEGMTKLSHLPLYKSRKIFLLNSNYLKYVRLESGALRKEISCNRRTKLRLIKWFCREFLNNPVNIHRI